MKKTKRNILLLMFGILVYACKKDAFLAVKPDNSLLVPKSVADYQLILDADFVMNGASVGLTPDLLLTGEDNYYIPASVFDVSLNQYFKNTYVWADKPYPTQTVDGWNRLYTCIYYSNFVLEGLPAIAGDTSSSWLNANGSALFYRAHCFYHLAQTFAPAYDKTTSATDPGIPLRLQSDVNEKMTRATVAQTYDRIIADLQLARTLLPARQPTYLTRPSQSACMALLARTYQTMQQYDSAGKYADAALQLQNNLLNYNDYPVASFPFPRFSQEIIFHSIASIGANNYGNIDSVLYNSYDSNDLRKPLFFKLSNKRNKFIGSYDGTARLFGGLATDEMYLIRAECFARAGNTSAAMNDLNSLLINRYKTSTFIPYTATTASEALDKILTERRKELCFRGLRWTDARRLNKEGANIILQRSANGQSYQLMSNSAKWVWPVPDDVLSFNPGMAQNPR